MTALFSNLVLAPAGPSTSLWLANGAVDVVVVAAIAFALIQTFKAGIDRLINPSNPEHDMAVWGLDIVTCIVLSLIAQAIGPIGLHGGQDVIIVATDATSAMLTSLGLYRLSRGSAGPATPVITAANVTLLASAVEAFLARTPAAPVPVEAPAVSSTPDAPTP